MVGLSTVFWMLVAIFALVGLSRGWAREALVAFAALLALLALNLLDQYGDGLLAALGKIDPGAGFWLRLVLLAGLFLAGYRAPRLSRIAGSPKLLRGGWQDSLFGMFLGILNGYLVAGTAWTLMHQANYPLGLVEAPLSGTAAGDAALRILAILPLSWLGAPLVYFVTAVALVCMVATFL